MLCRINYSLHSAKGDDSTPHQQNLSTTFNESEGYAPTFSIIHLQRETFINRSGMKLTQQICRLQILRWYIAVSGLYSVSPFMTCCRRVCSLRRASFICQPSAQSIGKDWASTFVQSWCWYCDYQDWCHMLKPIRAIVVNINGNSLRLSTGLIGLNYWYELCTRFIKWSCLVLYSSEKEVQLSCKILNFGLADRKCERCSVVYVAFGGNNIKRLIRSQCKTLSFVDRCHTFFCALNFC